MDRAARGTAARGTAAWAAAAAGAIALAACASLALGRLEPPRFSQAAEPGSELRLLPPSGDRPVGGAALRLWARVENPNDFGLRITRLEGDLYVEDAEGIEVGFPLGLPLTSRQDTVIPLDTSVGFDRVPDLAERLLRAAPGNRVDYRIDGTFGVDAGPLGEPTFGPRTLLEGELRLVR